MIDKKYTDLLLLLEKQNDNLSINGSSSSSPSSTNGSSPFNKKTSIVTCPTRTAIQHMIQKYRHLAVKEGLLNSTSNSTTSPITASISLITASSSPVNSTSSPVAASTSLVNSTSNSTASPVAAPIGLTTASTSPVSVSTSPVERRLIPSSMSTATIAYIAQELRHDLETETRIESLRLGGFALGNVGSAIVSQAVLGLCNILSLDLGFNEIGNAGSVALSSVLSHNAVPHLNCLYLSGNAIRVNGITALATALRSNTCLSSLYLSGNSLGEEELLALSPGIAENKGLTALYLGSNRINPTGLTALLTALQKGTSQLKALMLGQNNLGQEGMACLANAFNDQDMDSLSSIPNGLQLQTLEIASNKINAEGTRALATSLSRPNTIENLYMDNNPIGDIGAAVFGILLTKNQTLRVLDLSFCQLGIQGFRAIATGLQHSSSLISLLLNGNLPSMILSPAASDASLLSARILAAALFSNKNLALVKLTGVDLYRAASDLKLPERLHAAGNEEILHSLRQWHLYGHAPTSARHFENKKGAECQRRHSWHDVLKNHEEKESVEIGIPPLTELEQVRFLKEVDDDLGNLRRRPFNDREWKLLSDEYLENEQKQQVDESETSSSSSSSKRKRASTSSSPINRYPRVVLRVRSLAFKWNTATTKIEGKKEEAQLALLLILRQLHYLIHVLTGLADAPALIDTLLG